MKSPSKNFLTMLEILDPLLSVRWGEIIGQFVIERKAHIPLSEIQFLERRSARLKRFVLGFGTDTNNTKFRRTYDAYVGTSEEFLSAKAGRRVILFAPELTDSVYNQLCAADMQRYGGYSRYADEIEAKEMAAEADRERIWENERKAMNGEVYDMLNHIWSHKETQLLDGQKNMQKLLHGRIKDTDEPLIKTAF